MARVRLNLFCQLSSFHSNNISIKGGLTRRIRISYLSTTTSTPPQSTPPPPPLPQPPYKVVFIGSDSFSLPTFTMLRGHLPPGNLSVVVSSPSNVVGRYAQKHGQRIYLWKDFRRKDFEFEGEEGDVRKRYDFGVVASFGYLIPSWVIDRFPLGILNVHASLLPRLRGASPINHSIMNGDTETGISIMRITPHKFDTGPVLTQAPLSLSDQPRITAPELLTLLSRLGATTLLQVLQNLPHHLDNPIPQDESLATFAPKLTPELAEVDWESKTAEEVCRLHWGLCGSYRLRSTLCQGRDGGSHGNRRVDFDEIEPITNYDPELGGGSAEADSSTTAAPGHIVYDKQANSIRVLCAGSTWVAIKKLKVIDGTKWMTAKDFRNGYLSKKVVKSSSPSSSSSHFYFRKISNSPSDGDIDIDNPPACNNSQNQSNNDNLIKLNKVSG